MPRQSFLSTEFFVTASVEEAKRAVCVLPLHVSHIKLLKENTLANSIRFLYEHPGKQTHSYLDVSILPLDTMYVCVSLHGSFTNGQSFHSDPDISSAMQYFKKAVNAALKNDFSSLQIKATIKGGKKKQGYFIKSLLSIFLSKYPA